MYNISKNGKREILRKKWGNKMKKRLYKSKNDKKLCGVCAGIAEYFEIDPTIVRLAWVAFVILGGSGILAYIIAALVIPNEKDDII